MSWWRRLTGSASRAASSAVASATPASAGKTKHRDHLAQFVQTRREVEAFIEPASTLDPVTILLVARDGEWTRRPVGDEKVARAFAKDMNIPVYDIRASGYPSSMREYNERQKAEKKRRQSQAD